MKDPYRLTYSSWRNKRVRKVTAVLNDKDTANEEILYMAQELSNKKWKLGFSDGAKQRQVTIEAGNWLALHTEIDRAKEKFHLAKGCRIVSCYEAGRDGFWIHRRLVEDGIKNLVVDSSSIEVNRRSRRAKTDGVDVKALLARSAIRDEFRWGTDGRGGG